MLEKRRDFSTPLDLSDVLPKRRIHELILVRTILRVTLIVGLVSWIVLRIYRGLP